MTAAKRTAPISSHPAFKWGVGAWFALLLGLGLFVMPAEVHLLLAERLGLGAVLTGAAAIRAVLSVGAALLGLAIGLVLALRVAALNDASEDLDDEPAVSEAVADTDDVWLPDAAPARDVPARRTHPLRAQASRSQEVHEPQEFGPRVEDAPRRPFNPREDLAEEGIAPFEPDAEESLFEGEDIAEGLAGDFALHAPEAVPENPYFAEAWDPPTVELSLPDGDADPVEAGEDDMPIALPPVEEDSADEPFDEDAYAAPEPEPDEEEPVLPALPPAALGDLSLEALTARLESALEAAKPGPPTEPDEEPDPVIAFLRREAERETPAIGAGPRSSDPQAELRSALDKLSRVGKPK